jgi:hypothetical protein
MTHADDAAFIFAAGSAMLQHSHLMRQQWPSEPIGFAAVDRQQPSDHKEETGAGAAVVPGGLTLKDMAFSDDAPIDWEYGPISFSQFEHSLRVASDELDDEQITASIFDLPPEHDNTNTSVSENWSGSI